MKQSGLSEMHFKRTGIKEVLRLREKNGVPFLTFPMLERCGMVRHGFSTRMGGVSRGYLSSMNLGFSRGDDPSCVTENYSRLAEAVGVSMEQMVLSCQTHTTNVRTAEACDAGNGITKPLPYTDVDGLITDVPGLALVTLYADCVPLYFVDPVRRVIGLSHSGWRGTVNRMGRVTIEKMREAYGCDPSDILAAVGPSICRDCYEVSEDVAEAFREAFGSGADQIVSAGIKTGKYQLDLWEANRQILLEAGIRREHLSVTDLCTCCNSQLLFSHCASKGKRGNLAAVLCLKES